MSTTTNLSTLKKCFTPFHVFHMLHFLKQALRFPIMPGVLAFSQTNLDIFVLNQMVQKMSGKWKRDGEVECSLHLHIALASNPL